MSKCIIVVSCVLTTLTIVKHIALGQKVPCNMHKPFKPRCVHRPSALTTARHIQICVDATDHESRICSLLLLKRRTEIGQGYSGSPLLYTAHDGVTDKIHLFYFKTLLIRRWGGFIQMATRWEKGGVI